MSVTTRVRLGVSKKEVTAAFAAAAALFFLPAAASGQDLATKRYALPLPPAPLGSIPRTMNLRFDAAKSKEENEQTRVLILDQLRAAQQRLKATDRENVRGIQANEALPPPTQDVGRKSAVQDALDLERARRRFEIESICGPTDDTQDVELYDGGLGVTREFVQARQPSTAQIQWNGSFESKIGPDGDAGNVQGLRWCTGTLILDRLFLTAGHCFEINSNGWTTPMRQIASRPVSLPPDELAQLMHVNFNYQRDASRCTNPSEPRTCQVRQAESYPIVRLLENKKGNLDYAIAELGPGPDGRFPGQRYGSAIFDASSTTLAQARILTIVQHPNGVPKRVGAGRQLRISGNTIFYSEVDTLGGSSGAGVIDQDGRVIGVHTTGGCGQSGGENSGVVLRAVSQVSDIIR